MDIQTRKIEFVQEFLKLQSEEAISLFETMLQSETNGRFQPMSMEEFNARIDKSMEDSKNGKIIEASKLREKVSRWR